MPASTLRLEPTLEHARVSNLRSGSAWSQAAEGELEAPLNAALEAGYRHIDTAASYFNEALIGKVLNQWISSGRVKREDLFIVTKLPAAGIKPGGPQKWLSASLQKLGLDYVDLYLAHVPFCAKEDAAGSPFPVPMQFEPDTDHAGMWRDMEAEVLAGRAKAIGLSNYSKRLIQIVLDNCRIKPANLQVELHVYMQQKPLVDFCHQNGITVCAYFPIGTPGSKAFAQSSFTRGMMKLPDLINDPTILEVAKKYKKTPGQVLLKHIVQRGVCAIPKSLSKERIEQNIALFDWELSKEDTAKIDALDKGKAGRILSFLFLGIPESHPAFPFQDYP
ncbi:aldose reductase-like [Thrips palmi]|uniref:Aldose reductase-like n=1 Tax=Thrips palmi TaxID=161013 RepID=A0A6P8ZPH6_THRPL|nr:aldose reductase-like [Thrips palmi]